MNRLRNIVLLVLVGLTFASCSKFKGIDIKGVKDVKFKGMQNGVIFLNLTFDVDNPNSKKIVIKNFEFNAWLNDRALGKLRSTEKIVLVPETRADYVVPVEIKLRTAADAFKLLGSGKKLLSMIKVEGYVKGGKFPIVKKIKIPKQTLDSLMKEKQNKLVITDTLSRGVQESNN
ncbi:MAG: LEA type 2 family protein [Bacteroidales bacterium]